MISKLENRRVLVTGGCGFIGSHLIPFLLAKGSIVTVIDDLSTGPESNLPHHENLTLIKASVLDTGIIRAFARDSDLIFHMASLVGMKLVAKKPQYSYDVSKIGTENILELSGKVPTVLFSSSAVYGLTKKAYAVESKSISAKEALEYDGNKLGYASGKWAMEQAGIRAMEAGKPVMIIRPFNIVGHGQVTTYGMVVPNFVDSAMKGLPLTIYDSGHQTRSFSCVEVFCAVMEKLITQPAAWQRPNNIINIGSDQMTSINELAHLTIESLESKSTINYVPYDSVFPCKKDVLHRRPDLSRLETLVGAVEWPSIRSIVEALEKHKAVLS